MARLSKDYHNMKKLILFAFVIILAFCGGAVRAQGGHNGGGDSDGSHGGKTGKLDRFRQMKMIEALDLKEDEAIRFFAKQNIHEKTMQDLMKKRGAAMDALQSSVKDSSNDGGKALDKLIDAILATDQEIFKERNRYQDEIRQMLKPQQFAKFLLFERNFGRDIRGAIRNMVKERTSRHDYDDR
jgi:hypothetical protein